MSEATGLWGLFFSSFLAATLLPGGSEALLLWLQHQQTYHWPALLLTATLGNTLGGLSSWGIGRWLRHYYPNAGLSKPRQQQALGWLEKHGSPLLLISWVPIVGDPLCVAAGWVRTPLLISGFFIALGKGIRYGILLWLGS
jgi:membrane protein YqaA with SNARE-associated domain